MGQTHSHSHPDRAYYLEQLCTIGACGALGVVAILMYRWQWLGILADPFHLPVLLGGIALLVVVAIRAAALWQAVAVQKAHEHHHHHHDHDHDHAHAHEHHDHGHDHAHPHPHHGHDHGHEHEHGWAPVRYIVLMLPVALFLLGMPNPAFIQQFQKYLMQWELGKLEGGQRNLALQDLPGKTTLGMRIDRDAEKDELKVLRTGKDSPAAKAGLLAGDRITQITRTVDADGKPLAKLEVISTKGLELAEVAAKLEGPPNTTVRLTIERDGQASDKDVMREVDTVDLQFKELERAAYTPIQRQFYEGKIGKIIGQFVPSGNPRAFSLTRYKITCCAADAIPLNVAILLDPQVKENISSIPGDKWVEVRGRIEFRQRSNRAEYMSVLVVPALSDIRVTDPDPNPFIQ